MNLREFLSAGVAGLSLSAKALSEQLADQKPKRVGIIGPGWYGKCDLFRLIQVSPIEVVSMCDVDKQMLVQAAEMVAARQVSKKTPRLYGDYREMLKEKDLDICLVDTPDHWHALPMIAAVQSGADVWVQKPISVDVVEGQSMLAAARKHGRVVQVGTQRRSTPHLVEARDQIVREGKLGKVGLVEIYCYYPMRLNANPPNIAPPITENLSSYSVFTAVIRVGVPVVPEVDPDSETPPAFVVEKSSGPSETEVQSGAPNDYPFVLKVNLHDGSPLRSSVAFFTSPWPQGTAGRLAFSSALSFPIPPRGISNLLWRQSWTNWIVSGMNSHTNSYIRTLT